MKVIRWLLVCLAMATLSACTPPTPIPPPPAGAWLVFLCQASDNRTEPHDIAFYRNLFDAGQRDLLFDYFKQISGGRVDLSRTEVYGWFPMGASVTQAALDPAERNNNKPVTRVQTAQDCKSAGVAALLASNRQIDPSRYDGFIAVINVPVDAGQAGTGALVANQYETPAFYAHEMLHVMGLGHSNVMSADTSANHNWNAGADATYGDCWDIMSFLTCTYWFDVPGYGGQGPELQNYERLRKGWISSSRVFTKAGGDLAASTVTLAPTSEPQRSGNLLADIEVLGVGRYLVEYRVRSGFDRGIPRNAVVIRELRSNGGTYLVKRQGGRIDWQTGDRFTDQGSFLSITVDSMTPTAATITINPRFAGGTAQLGEKCGDKYKGEVLQCPSGSTCQPRRNPPLVTTEYFCQ